MAAYINKPFQFHLPEPYIGQQPVVRLKQSYYELLQRLKRETGLSLGEIVAQCMDYALANRVSGEEES